MIAFVEGREQVCTLASLWAQYELNALLWFLYLVFAQLQCMQTVGSAVSGPASQQLIRLSSLVDSFLIFKQIDKITTLLRKLSHNMNVNQTLVLEDMLLALAVKP